MVARKPTDVVKLQLRLQEGMRWRLERAAARNSHSMNTEILVRLRESLDRDWGGSNKNIASQTNQRILTINAKLDRLIALAEGQKK